MFSKDDIMGVLLAVGILVAIGFLIALVIGFIRIKLEDLSESIREVRFNNRFKTLGYIQKVHYRNINEYMRFRKILNKQTSKILKNLSPEYFVYKNVCMGKLKTPDGMPKYIFCDFVILSKYGLFLIVNDNKMGIIEGAPYNPIITHYTTGVDKFSIINPNVYCEWLKNEFAKTFNLGFKNIDIHSYRVFSNKCRISFPYASNLINTNDLLYTISKCKNPCLSNENITKFASILSANTICSTKQMKTILLSFEAFDEQKIDKLPRRWI